MPSVGDQLIRLAIRSFVVCNLLKNKEKNIKLISLAAWATALFRAWYRGVVKNFDIARFADLVDARVMSREHPAATRRLRSNDGGRCGESDTGGEILRYLQVNLIATRETGEAKSAHSSFFR